MNYDQIKPEIIPTPETPANPPPSPEISPKPDINKPEQPSPEITPHKLPETQPVRKI